MGASLAQPRAPLLVQDVVEPGHGGGRGVHGGRGEGVHRDRLVVAERGVDGHPGEVLPQLPRRAPHNVRVGGAGLAPDIVCGQVPGPVDEVNVGVAARDVPIHGLYGPQRSVALPGVAPVTCHVSLVIHLTQGTIV